MNANVFLEADQGTLGLPFWPEEIRNNPASLDECALFTSSHTSRAYLEANVFPKITARLERSLNLAHTQETGPGYPKLIF